MAYEEIDDATLDEMEEALMANTLEIADEDTGADEAPSEENEGSDESADVDDDTNDESNDADDTDTATDTEDDTDTDNDDDADTDGDDAETKTETDEGSEEDADSTNHADETLDDESDDDGQSPTDTNTEDKVGDDADEAKPEFDMDEYNRLKEFHRKVTDTEIVINGVKTKPFTDPDKILKAQQASGGLSKKFEAIKGTRTVVDPLKKRGLLENTERFDLLMKVNDGDPEAIKELLKQSEIDPMELDMDEIKYEREHEASTDVDLMFKDALDIGEQFGVKEKVADVILKDWDDNARDVFFKDSSKAQAISAALAEQMSNGLYDRVMATADKMKSIDIEGRYTGMNAIDMYNEASKVVNVELDQERKDAQEKEAVAADKQKQADEQRTKVDAEKEKLRKKREQSEYEAKAKAQEDKVNKARKKATENTTKAKTKAAVSQEKYDPLMLDGDELEEFERGLMELYN